MHVVIKPIGRQAFSLPLESEPTWETAHNVGLGQASIGVVLTAFQRERIVLADVKLWGRYGLAWHGFGYRQPMSGAVVLQGMGAVLGFVYRAASTYTSSTVNAVLADIHSQVTTENPWALPSGTDYLAWVGNDTSSLASLELTADQSMAAWRDEVLKYTTWVYGWYPERVGNTHLALPHANAAPATAEYVVDVRESISYDFNEMDLETLANEERITYTDAGGAAQVSDTTDTDVSHYLPMLAASATLTKTMARSISSTSATDASAAGTAALATDGPKTVTGAVTTSQVRSIYGAPIPCSTVRSDKICRVVGLPSGTVTLPVARTSHTGETSVGITLGSAWNRLDVMLARMQANVRR